MLDGISYCLTSGAVQSDQFVRLGARVQAIVSAIGNIKLNELTTLNTYTHATGEIQKKMINWVWNMIARTVKKRKDRRKGGNAR